MLEDPPAGCPDPPSQERSTLERIYKAQRDCQSEYVVTIMHPWTGPFFFLSVLYDQYVAPYNDDPGEGSVFMLPNRKNYDICHYAASSVILRPHKQI